MALASGCPLSHDCSDILCSQSVSQSVSLSVPFPSFLRPLFLFVSGEPLLYLLSFSSAPRQLIWPRDVLQGRPEHIQFKTNANALLKVSGRDMRTRMN